MENDKYVRNFDEEEVQQINAGTLDWTKFFKDPSSKINMVPNQTFNGPADWNARVKKLQDEVDHIVDLCKKRETRMHNALPEVQNEESKDQ